MLELLASDWTVTGLAATSEFLAEYQALISTRKVEVFTANETQLVQMGTFSSNNAAIAWAPLPASPSQLPTSPWVLALDDVRDPGNLGTLLRIADWYGFDEVVCSTTTVDLFNPKVLHASMGSFTRVPVWYQDLEGFLEKTDRPVFGAYLEGDSVHSFAFPDKGVLLMGNEAKGIAPNLTPHVGHKIHIPQFGGAESLNVAAATAVICDNIRRHIS